MNIISNLPKVHAYGIDKDLYVYVPSGRPYGSKSVVIHQVKSHRDGHINGHPYGIYKMNIAFNLPNGHAYGIDMDLSV